MKLKKILAAFLAGAMVMCAAGCNSNSASSSEAESASSAETTTSAEETKAPEESSEVQTSAPESTEASSQESTPAEKTVIRIAGMTGPTSIGMVNIMENNDNAKAANKYEFTIAGSADEITPKLIKGELDMAAVPANLASVLYNKTEGKMTLLAVNTLGVLYVVDKGTSVSSIADLKGKTIYATGKGSTPEYTLRYILEKNDINPDTDVTFEWKSEPTEIVAAMKGDEEVVAMLPQPYVTVAGTQVEGLNVVLNLDEEWKKVSPETALVTGVVVARTEFVENNKDAVNSFLDEYKTSCEYAVSNVEDAANLVEKFGIFKAAIAKKAIPFCNIVFMEGEAMQKAVSAYYDILFNYNPKSVGEKLPADEYYYKR